MADLIDRIQGVGSRPKLPIHQFVAAIDEYVLGNLTKKNIVQTFDLQGDELTQAQTILDYIDLESTISDKINYVHELNDVMMLAEDPELGIYNTKLSIKARLEL